MTQAYDGRQVVGIDLHRRRSVIVRMTEDGRKLETVRITNSPAALRAVIARAGKNPRVVIEATYGWYWAVDVLEAAGAEVHLAHPLGVKAFSCRRVKNDERDAADLADLLRMGRLPEAWIAPPEIRELREISRYRHQLVKARTSVKDQVHGVLAKLGIPVRGHVTKQGSRMLRWAVIEVIQRQPAGTSAVQYGAVRLRGIAQHNHGVLLDHLNTFPRSAPGSLPPRGQRCPSRLMCRHFACYFLKLVSCRTHRSAG